MASHSTRRWCVFPRAGAWGVAPHAEQKVRALRLAHPPPQSQDHRAERGCGMAGRWGGLEQHGLKRHPQHTLGMWGQTLPAFNCAYHQRFLLEDNQLGVIVPLLPVPQQEHVQHLLHHWDLHTPAGSLRTRNRNPWSHRHTNWHPFPAPHPCMTWLRTTKAFLHHISDNSQALWNVRVIREGWEWRRLGGGTGGGTG